MPTTHSPKAAETDPPAADGDQPAAVKKLALMQKKTQQDVQLVTDAVRQSNEENKQQFAAINDALQSIMATIVGVHQPDASTTATQAPAATAETATTASTAASTSASAQAGSTLNAIAAANQAIGTAADANGGDDLERLETCSEYSVRQQAARKLHDLPQFNGASDEWANFSAIFEQSTAAFGYTDLDNNIRFRRCLVGAAKEAVEALLLDANDTPLIMPALERRFGRPDMLVQAHLRRIQIIAPIPENRPELLVPYAAKVANVVAAVDKPKTRRFLLNPGLLEDLVQKLPLSRRNEWGNYATRIDPYPTIRDFRTWLDEVANGVTYSTPAAVLAATNQLPLAHRPGPSSSQQPQRRERMLHTNAGRVNCGVCHANGHGVADCHQFKAADMARRWEIVRTNKLCIGCLQTGHVSKFCTGRKQCGIGGCMRPHHPALHSNPFDDRQNTSVVAARPAMVLQTVQPSQSTPPVLTERGTEPVGEGRMERMQLGQATQAQRIRSIFRMLPVKLTGPAGTVSVFALFDEGSSVTVIERSLADWLQLDGPETRLDLQWIGNRFVSEQSRTVALAIRGDGTRARSYQLNGVRTLRDLDLTKQSVDMGSICATYAPMRGLPIRSYTDAVPQIIIGIDNAHLGVAIRHVCGMTAGPVAAKTRLGWTIGGPLTEPNASAGEMRERVMTTRPTWLDELHQAMKEYFSVESIGVYRPADALESRQDRRAREIMAATTRQVGANYETGLLWRQDEIRFPDSKPMAAQRLQLLERKMARDSAYAEKYKAIIDGLVTNGYARRLTKIEVAQSDDKCWYLPHFATLNPNKPGKMRVVFDAAARVGDVSLNSALLKGPDNNRSLIDVLHNFRLGAIGICADIKEMFLRVRIRAEDQHAQWFLWRDSVDKPVDTYVMQSMIFGAACSPSSAQYVKNKNADENGIGQAEAVRLIKEAHYVDDFVASFDNTGDAIRTTRAVVDIHRKGGFELRGFVSNDLEVVRSVGSADAATDAALDMQLDAAATQKILGMFWCTQTDAFMFRLDFNRVDEAVVNGTRVATRREMASAVMAIYDPFGILANFTIYGKLLLQDMCRTGCQLDDKAPEDVHKRWCQWVAKFVVCRAVRVPRHYGAHIKIGSVQLHIYADSSQSAMSAVAYWRMDEGGDSRRIAFVIGKSRVAPPKLISVPRLELQAVILAVRLNKHIRATHRIDIERTVYWTDSKTVVQWIRSDRSQFPPFVAHRLAEIWEESTVAEWRWVPTHLNAADDATRAVYPVRYAAVNRWIDGPDYLRLPEDQWPAESATMPCEEGTERGPPCSVLMVCERTILPVVQFTRFSNYCRLLRSMAYVLRFIHNCRSREKVVGDITATEIDGAEKHLVRAVQQEAFAEELTALKRGDGVAKNSGLHKLLPFVDRDGVLRVNGRIDRAEFLPADTRQPMILPHSHGLTNIMAVWYHRRMRHQQLAAVIGEIRTKFWVTNLRTLVKRVKAACMLCRLRSTTPAEPVMGQLPIDRLTPHVRAFTYTGVDYFGPIDVTVGRRRETRYVALFTCMTVRAVHLEMATNLSTDSFLLCLRNFINLRGTPKVIRSDNGTNFVGAARELREAVDMLDHAAIQAELGVERIEWKFNCPRHPQAGGCWERLVQCVKRVLAVTVKEVAPRTDTLRSLLLEAANIVNSRPLTHLPVSCDEDEPLTPNHFLLGAASSTQTPSPCDAKLICLRKQWRVAQALKNRFWKRWMLEYLPDLTRRAKGYDEQPEMKVGVLVLMVDPLLPRGQWRRGRVAEVYAGIDGRVRYALVKTKKESYKRPVSKLAVLNVDGES